MVGNSRNWLNIVGLVDTHGQNNSEETVVEDSCHIINWLVDISIIAGSGTEWLEPVETG